MWRGVDVHDRSLIILKPRSRILGGFSTVESGRLFHPTGDEVIFSTTAGDRLFTDAELQILTPVTARNRIQLCHGFDLFIILH
jgi:hypothetical protein